MKAEDAKQLSEQGHPPFMKLKLIWFCGLLDTRIKRAAKYGKYKAMISNINRADAKAIFPTMKKYYENDGYIVAYSTRWTYFNDFIVIWNYNKLDGDEKFEYIKSYHYDYHTTVEEN